jgi:hypothetical protein
MQHPGMLREPEMVAFLLYVAVEQQVVALTRPHGPGGGGTSRAAQRRAAHEPILPTVAFLVVFVV